MLNSIVSNSNFGKRPADRVKPIFGPHVGPHIPNIGYFEIYESVYRYIGVYEVDETHMDSGFIRRVHRPRFLTGLHTPILYTWCIHLRLHQSLIGEAPPY